MRHSFYISFWLMIAWLVPCTLVCAQTPFDAFSPETSRIILDGDSIAAWRAEQQSQLSQRRPTLLRPDTILCTLIADLRNEQLLLVDIATHRPVAAAPFTDEIKNWLSVDPLVDKNITTSPYLYCNGNPIMFIDPDGMIPNESEAAAMAAYAYGDADENKLNEQLGKWEPIEEPDVFFGYRAVLFGRDVDGKKEYAYAFAGTDSHSVFDIVSDIAQATDCLSQYEIAIAMARFMAFKYRGEVLTFVGHSLGGGEATAAAMATGKKAITFNPAAVSLSTARRNLLFFPASIENYVVDGDPLTIGQKYGNLILTMVLKRSGLILLPGKTTIVPQVAGGAHTIDNFLKY